MSQQSTERQEDKKRKAIFSGNQGIRRDVWEEAMRLTRQSEHARRGPSHNNQHQEDR